MSNSGPLFSSIDSILDKRVSDLSVWTDDVWRFKNPTAGKNTEAVNWDVSVGGERLLAPRWANLLQANKLLLWSLIEAPQHGRSYKPGQIGVWAVYMRFAVAWMMSKGITSFAEVDEAACRRFKQHLIAEKSKGGRLPLREQAHRYLNYFVMFFQQQHVLIPYGVQPMPAAPFGGELAYRVAKAITIDESDTRDPLPDAEFIACINTAVTWITDFAPQILALLKLVIDTRTRNSHLTICQVSRKMNVAVADFQRGILDKVGTANHPLREPLAGGDVRSLLTDLRTACTIVLQALVGVRISEVVGLYATKLGRDGPAYVSVRKTKSGFFDLFLLEGRLFKTTESYIWTVWTAGLRPVGTDYTPLPILACQILEELYEAWRDPSGLNDLIITLEGRRGVPHKFDGATPVLASEKIDQHDWVVRRVGISPSQRITSGRWRPGFVRNLFRVDHRLLPAISEHLKHVSLAMTDEGYLGHDVALLAEIEDQVMTDTLDYLFDIAAGKPITGPLVDVIHDRATAFVARHANRSDDEVREDLRDFIEGSQIRVWKISHAGKEYCDCIFRPGKGHCRPHGLGRLVRPDPRDASPDSCAGGCEGISVQPEHADVWLERLETNIAIRAANEGVDVNMAALADKRVWQAARILERLNALPEKHRCELRE